MSWISKIFPARTRGNLLELPERNREPIASLQYGSFFIQNRFLLHLLRAQSCSDAQHLLRESKMFLRFLAFVFLSVTVKI